MSLKKIYNHLSGKDLKRLHRKGARKQIEVNNLKKEMGWVQRNVTQKEKYNKEIDKLQSLDKKFDREKKRLFHNRVLGTTAVGAPIGGVLYEASTEKTASTSRLMSILRGTRQKAIKRRTGQIEKKMETANKRPFTSDKRHIELSNHHDKLRRENLKETGIRAGTYIGLGSLPVLGAGYTLKKEARLTLGKVSLGAILAGGGIGAGINIADKDIENNASNISQSAALGAGTVAIPTSIAYAASKNPGLKKAIMDLYNKSKG